VAALRLLKALQAEVASRVGEAALGLTVPYVDAKTIEPEARSAAARQCSASV
jgi:hypothetical protein